MPVQAITLPSGTAMPALAWGLGTSWFVRQPADLDVASVPAQQQGVLEALRAGFRHLDSAQMYNNEADTGAALEAFLAESGVSRSDVFVTGKVANPSLAAGRVREACLDSLRRLRVSYLDLWLVHSPFAGDDLQATWAAMEALVDEGLVKDVGVSNFRISDLRKVLAVCRVRPAVNQVEHHPCLTQPHLTAFCAEHGIPIVAYCPLAPLTLFPGSAVDAAVAAAAAAHGTDAAAVLIAWALAHGRGVVTTSTKSGRAAAALKAAELVLTAVEVAAIDTAAAAASPRRRFWYDAFGADLGLAPS